MPTALQPVLVFVFLIGILISIGDLVAPFPQHTAFALDMTPIAGRQDTYRLDALTGLTVRAGVVQAGDELRLLDRTAAHRLLVAPPRTPVPFLDATNGSTVMLVDTVTRAPRLAPWKLLRVAVEATALVLLLLRGSMVPAVGLATFLFMTEFAAAVMTGAYLGTWWRVTYSVVQSASVAIGRIGLIVLAAGFASPSQAQRIAVRALIALSVAWIVWSLASAAYGTLAGETAYIGAPDKVLELILTVGALGLFVHGITRTHGTARRRLVVLAIAVLIGSSADLYGFFGPSIYNTAQSSVAFAALIVMTIGLAYAILVDRMFDFAFVVNRAVVFGTVSAIVLPFFIAIEWLVGKEAAKIGNAQGPIEMGLAVLIGLSLRPLHQRVDAVVDRVFFAVRHRNAKAVLRFAEECYDIESRDRLLQHTVETVRRFGRVQGCAVLLADEHGDLHESAAVDLHVPALDRDHLVTLRLRSSRRPLQRGGGSPLDMADVADAAFPIPGRKRLAGALLCALPARAEPFSPEEFGALAKLAHELGAALLAIDAADAQRLREELALLRAATPSQPRRRAKPSAGTAPRAKHHR